MVKTVSTQRIAGILGSVLVAISLLFANPAGAQSAPEVLQAFRKLQADTEAGMTNSEYARGLAAVNAQLRSFADANPGKPPAAIEVLRSAFAMYVRAKTAFDEQKLQAMRYDNGEMSLRDYYDWKRANISEISSLWEQAGREVDRAAGLLRRKQQQKSKKTP